MTDKSQNLITPVLIAGCAIIVISFSIRASFGVFQIPIATEFNWLRAEFSLAIAIQNLAWGIGQPLFGAFAEKFGDRRALASLALALACCWPSWAAPHPTKTVPWPLASSPPQAPSAKSSARPLRNTFSRK